MKFVVEKAVVLQEADVDARENPRDGRLRERLLAPRLESLGSSPCRTRPLVLGAEVRTRLDVRDTPLGQVIFQFLEEFPEVTEEPLGVDHSISCLPVTLRPNDRWSPARSAGCVSTA